MECLDLKGKACPVPVLETKRLLESKEIDDVQVFVDNDTSRQNVTRFLESRGYQVLVERRDDGYCLTAHHGLDEGEADVISGARKVVVLIDGETMGRGNEELGVVLMRSFLHTLKELKPLPWKLIFLNTGVRLATEGSDYLSVLKEIAELGVELLSCGTCLDFFDLKDKLAAGRVTNMYEIASSLAEAGQILKP